MWQVIRFYVQRARELRSSGQLGHAILSRLRRRHAEARFNAEQSTARVRKEYSADLPVGYPARKITLSLSVPFTQTKPNIAFTDHVVDQQDRMTNTVLATMRGGFVVSRDLGKTWKIVKVEGHAEHYFINVKDIGLGEFLIQTIPPQSRGIKNVPLDMLVVNESGKVIVKHPAHSHRWHGSRSAAIAGSTILFAEYLSNIAVDGKRPADCKVWRSRDRGRSWEAVFEQLGGNVRHFHFLQPRPGNEGEWWLTSGDLPSECHIWVTHDDGDNWDDISTPRRERIKASGEHYKRDLFRLTDLAWVEGDVIWGTDDHVGYGKPPGARVFRSAIGRRLEPELIGIGRWHFRNMVDIGDFLLLLSQRSNVAGTPDALKKPSVHLVPKKAVPGAPGMVHVCDLDIYPTRDRPGFTFSKASRAAVDGTFFTYRSSEDVFPAGHRILEWKVTLE
ncbi:MAG TPA: hypothetical protein VMF58_10725 [Rhizomicrobium sp.]|nr:hypothetical protein [Rhizomicrobium sp.]